LDTYRTMCCAPRPDLQQLLKDVQILRFGT
jgi:hypothetical protein